MKQQATPKQVELFVADIYRLFEAPFPSPAANSVVDNTIQTVARLERQITEERLMKLAPWRTHLAEEHIVAIFAAFSQHLQEREAWVVNLSWHRVWKGLVRILREQEAVSVSLLGTGWRLLHLVSETYGAVTDPDWALPSILTRKDAPLEVVARSDAPEFFPHMLGDAPVRIAQSYPDLADFPQDLAWQVLGTQPIPDEWFVDAFPLPNAVEQLAPGVQAYEVKVLSR